MRFLLLLLGYITCLSSIAQPIYRFEKWLGDTYCYDAEVLGDGNIAALIQANDNANVPDTYVAIYDPNGVFLFRVNLMNSGIENPQAITATADSGYVVCGKTNSNGGDIFVARFNKSHQLLWTRTFIGSGEEAAHDILYTSDGQIVVCGYTRSFGAGDYNSLLLKFSGSGTLLWSRIFESPNFDAAFRLLEMHHQYYISTNTNVSSTWGKGDMHLIKMDTSAKILWSGVYGRTDNDLGWNMLPTIDGKIAFTMASSLNTSSNKQLVFMKIDTSGSILNSVRLVNGNDAVDAFDLVQDPNGHFTLVGHTFSSSNLVHMLVIRLDGNGEPIHAHRSNFTQSSEIWRILKTNPYSYKIFGHGKNDNSTSSELVFIACDSSAIPSCKKWQTYPLNKSNAGINFTKKMIYTVLHNGSAATVNWSSQLLNARGTVKEENIDNNLNSSLPSVLSYCNPDSTILDAGSFTHYLWGNGLNTRTIRVDSFGTYKVRISSNQCINDDSVKIVQAVPQNLQLADNICERDSAYLFVQPLFGNSYSWDFSPGNYQGYTKNEGWNYIDIYEPSKKCQSRDSVWVQLTLNHGEIIIDTLIPCFNQNLFRAFPKYTFRFPHDSLVSARWWIDGTQTDTNINTSWTANTAGQKNLLLITESQGGCIDSLQYSFIIHPSPVAKTRFIDTIVCESNLPITLYDSSWISNGTFQKSWYWNGQYLGNQDSLVFDSLTNGKIALEVVSDSGCSDLLEFTLSLHPNPIARNIIRSTASQCLKGNFFVFDDSSYTPGSSIRPKTLYTSEKNALLTPTNNGLEAVFLDTGWQYLRLEVESDQGCYAADTSLIRVLPSPEARLWTNKSLFCSQEDTLYLVDSTVFPFSFISTLYLPQQDSLFPFLSHSIPMNKFGAYPFQLVVEGNNGCIDTAVDTVQVHDKVRFHVSIDSLSQCENTNYIAINSFDSLGSIVQQSLSFGDGTILSSPPFTHQFAQDGTYKLNLKATSTHGCIGIWTDSVTVYPNPAISIQVEPACLGDSSFFSWTDSAVNAELTGWSWDFGDGSNSNLSKPKHHYPNAGNFPVALKVENVHGCIDSTYDPKGALIRSVFTSSFSVDTLEKSYEHDQYLFRGENPFAVRQNWYIDGLFYSSQASTLYENRSNGKVQVDYITIDSFGCASRASDSIFFDFNPLLAVPNAFTPNSDQLNPIFKPVGVKFNKDYTLSVFSRWGELIFESKNPEIGWDGTLLGKPCPVDIYVYQIILDGGKYSYYGTLHLIR